MVAVLAAVLPFLFDLLLLLLSYPAILYVPIF